MKLEKFRITNFRSIKDSGWVEVGSRAILVGRNESGKSNMLLALRTLKSSKKMEPMSLTRDFPADVPRSGDVTNGDVVHSVWTISEAERDELARIYPAARTVNRIEVGRGYESECWVRFEGLKSEPAAPAPAVKAEPPVDLAAAAASLMAGPLKEGGTSADEDSPTHGAITLANSNAAKDNAASKLLDSLTKVSEPESSMDAGEGLTSMDSGMDSEKAARDWVMQHLPTFTYLDDYPDINGHQHLGEFLKRKMEKKPAPGDVYFEKLLIAAEIDPNSIDRLLTADSDTRRQQMNLAGSIITRKLRQLWSDRSLKVRFDLDGEHFRTLISDPNSIYDVEINLSERSRGFRWFFSFYVSFAADAKSGATGNTLLLLDEPGLHLHPLGQRDLLDHLAADFDNQVLVTTQSPFLVPADDIASVRTVSIDEETGTTVSNYPTGDRKTMFPLIHALSMQVAKGLMREETGLVVQEVSDLWYLRGVSNLIREGGGVGLPSQLSIFPAGGSTEVMYMAALLGGPNQHALLLQPEPPSNELPLDPKAKKLMPASNVVYIGDPNADYPSVSADIEDLIDPRIYDQLVRNAYKSQLEEDRPLASESAHPRMIQRYEAALEPLGIEFSRERVARVFLRAMSQNPEAVLPEASREKFEELFKAIRARLETLGS